jgi:hypothetical protein
MMETAMNDKKRNLLIGGVATVLMGLFALSFLIKNEVPAPVLKPAPVVEEVHMPPPPPVATPEQIAAADAVAAAQLASVAAEESAAASVSAAKKKSADKTKAELKKPVAAKAVAITDAEAKAKADASAKAALEADARLAAKRSNEKKDLERIPAPDATAVAAASNEPATPKSARFNMTQGGKKMTPEDFDAWMKAQGIRIVPAKPAVEPVKVEGAGKEG